MYQELIDSMIQERNDERQLERGSDTGEWHPSALTGCSRNAVYDYKGYEKSDAKEMRNIRIMDRGTEIHEIVQDAIETSVDSGGFYPEVKVDYAGIKGSCDGLLWVGDNEFLQPIYEVQEFKSISPMGKRYMKGVPKPDHVKQARIYHACLRAVGDFQLSDTVRITYFDRDDWSVVEYEVPAWTEFEFQEFLGDVADLEEHVDEGTLPDRMPRDSKGKKFWLCNYCDYRTRCWDDGWDTPASTATRKENE